MNTTRQAVSAALLSVGLSACSNLPPLPDVEHVDLERFMGDWYVIANIPTFLERDAHNAVESYELAEDGSIATTFTFRAGSFDGPEKTYHPRGFVRSESNAIWGMQFIWPIKADYRIAYLDPDYTVTVIGRNKRDYVWIMARSAEISMPLYNELVAYVSANGYDISKLQRVPQQW
jgi:apolipoprotein D and lipocalin family protein